MATTTQLIAAVTNLENRFEAAEATGDQNIAGIESDLLAAQAACYSAGLTDEGIYGPMVDTAVAL